MKVEPEQGGKTYRKISWVRLRVGNYHLGVEVRLGEPVISMKTPKDSSRVRLGVASLCLEIFLQVLPPCPGSAFISISSFLLDFQSYSAKHRRMRD